MLETTINGMKYLRTVFKRINISTITSLKEKYDYIYFVSYEKKDIQDFFCLYKKTAVIDLTKGLERVYYSFNKATRKQVNKSNRIQGLDFVSLDTNSSQAYNILSKFELSQGRTPPPSFEFSQSMIFSAYYNKRLIAYVSLFINDGIIREIYKASVRLEKDDIPLNIISCAGRRIVYEICKYGINNGYDIYDLAVVNLTDPQKAGISKYKMSFTKTLIDTYIYRFETSEFIELREKLLTEKNLYIH